MSASPQLAALVPHWRTEQALGRLFAAWPQDPRFELVVVDNGSDPALRPAVPAGVRWIDPGRNLGFAGAVERALAATEAPLVLLLNPDARPGPGALPALLEGFARHPDASGMVPALDGPSGDSQACWQLRPLPRGLTLLRQLVLLPGPAGPAREPAAGTAVEQPAAAALALRRANLQRAGGLDARFFPAWFEDVDLARRLHGRGDRLLYWPAARFVHDQGATVPRLGYRQFLWLYTRGLARYLAKHHPSLAPLLRLTLPLAALARALSLPLRAPRRAQSRRDALRGLHAAGLGALTGFSRPRDLARGWRVPEEAPPR
ncbi:MAG TPA: glycosyltransferase family 2 protein [Thermoanaerobaculia bacterium]|nr:glycosyltransferase family 2 protein [Thermoanaerobaculia bacterium]